MPDRWLARVLRRSYRQQMLDRADRNPLPLHSPAVVFAPHADDETLGCGGTILMKRRAGAAVNIVFMTDGRTSHAPFMPVDELVALRRCEAVEAGEKLGLTAENLIFLEYPDGELSSLVSPAVERVCDLLKTLQPEQVFVPFSGDPQPDHIATYQIVSAAVRLSGLPVTCYEYPVWFWYHWPWVSLRQPSLHEMKQVVKNTLQLGLFTTFDQHVAVETVLDEKRIALDSHLSQMTRLLSNPSWPILADVSRGEFLDCFFQPVEIFRASAKNGFVPVLMPDQKDQR
jgi:LmbE family N-acetylglucosaminyl deacetylase